MTRASQPPDRPLHVPLREREAHVWSVLPDHISAADALAVDCLSDLEKQRAGRMVSPVARTRFSVTRTALRSILSLYAADVPSALQITTGERGKPSLTDSTDVHFSLTHARELVLVAIARIPVGVDVEYVRQPRDIERLARRLLHESTVTTLLALPPERRLSAFLDAWTQREAHVKAVGGGLFHTPDVLPFDADAAADGTVRTVRNYDGTQTWSVARFIPAAGFRAALVGHGRVDALRFLEWNGVIS